jgi:flagellar biosynthesis/type III secretory pathway chaperone
VTQETTRFLELLERRIALLGLLGEALAAARADVCSLDIDSLQARIAQQEKLCREIRALDSQLDRVQRQCSTQIGAPSDRALGPNANPDSARLRETLQRLYQAQASVKQLNDAHQALLRRSRRTVNALLHSYHSFAMTYSNPAATGAAAGERL